MTFAQLVGTQNRLLVHSRRPLFLFTLYTGLWIVMQLVLRIVFVAVGSDKALYLDAFFGVVGTFIGMVIAIAWAAMVWRDEGPRTRSYHWSMPVDTSLHDTSRFAAGALWQVAGVTYYLVLALIAVRFYSPPGDLHRMHPLTVVTHYTTALLAYSFAICVSTVMDHAAEWILGVFIGLFMFGATGAIAGLDSFMNFALLSKYGVASTIYEGITGGTTITSRFQTPARWILATLLWSVIVTCLYSLALLKNRRTLRA